MRLLEIKQNGELELTNDLYDNIPPYAILSHTWGVDNEEVTYKDLVEGTGRPKLGYRKIQFCAERAAHNRLQYFWGASNFAYKILKSSALSSQRNLAKTLSNSLGQWTHVASTRQTAPSCPKQSTQCSGGIKMLPSAMYTYRMFGTIGNWTVADGSKEDGHFKSF